MVEHFKVFDSVTNGYYTGTEIEDFEFLDPVEQVKEMYISSQIHLEMHLLIINGYSYPKDVVKEVLSKRANKDWENKYQEIKKTAIPLNLLQLLECDSKKKQIALLKQISLTHDVLLAFIITAGENYGYTYSQYKSSHHHNGLDESHLPGLIHLDENNDITSIGTTDLTDGQLKQVIEHRHVTISKFLDKGDSWHCFFTTYNSLGGKENYKNGQPHFHYISNKWGLDRKHVLNELQNKIYKLPSYHVDYH